jgi:hypothetical protein
MPTDPSIILSSQQPDFGKIYSEALELRQMKLQQDQQNTLRFLASQPDAIDPKTGTLTPNTLAKYARVDPQGAAKLSAAAGEAEERKAQTTHIQSETQAQDLARHQGVLSDLLETYDTEVAGGHTDPTIAARELKTGVSEYVDALPVSDERKAAIKGQLSDMKPSDLRTLANRWSMTIAERNAAAKEEGEVTPYTMGGRTVFVAHGLGPDGKPIVRDAAGAPVEVTGPLEHPASEFNPARAAATADNRAPTLLTDPETNTQYWAYPGAKGEQPTYKTLSGDPYEPKGAGHIQSGQVRGGIAGAIMAAQTQNQKEGKGPLTADQVETVAADYSRKVQASVAFAKGKQGDQVRFNNVAVDHLQTMKDAALALKNGEIPLFNKLAQQIAQETGSPVPTNFDSLRQIVSQEVHKGVAGVGGSAEERSNLGNNLGRSASPEQLLGGITSVEKLQAGQLDGLRRQYETSTGMDNFDDMLSPNARALLKDRPDPHLGDKSGDTTSGGGATHKLPRDLPSIVGVPNGSKLKDKSGNVVAVARDGAWVAP